MAEDGGERRRAGRSSASATPETGPPTVLVADDHVPTRVDVCTALTAGGFAVCAEAGTAAETVRLAVQHRPDVALVDLGMPGHGLTAIEEIARRLPRTAVVVLTMSPADVDLFGAVAAGARGYLLKDVDRDRLPLALHGVLDGQAALPRTLLARLLREFLLPEPRRERLVGPGGVVLSEREHQTLDLLRRGLSTAQVADRLVVTPATVRSHVAAAVRKLQVATRQEAVALLAPPQA